MLNRVALRFNKSLIIGFLNLMAAMFDSRFVAPGSSSSSDIVDTRRWRRMTKTSEKPYIDDSNISQGYLDVPRAYFRYPITVVVRNFTLSFCESRQDGQSFIWCEVARLYTVKSVHHSLITSLNLKRRRSSIENCTGWNNGVWLDSVPDSMLELLDSSLWESDGIVGTLSLAIIAILLWQPIFK